MANAHNINGGTGYDHRELEIHSFVWEGASNWEVLRLSALWQEQLVSFSFIPSSQLISLTRGCQRPTLPRATTASSPGKILSVYSSKVKRGDLETCY